MPRIELIDVPLWQSNDPYHWEYDNLPLKNLMRRQNLINLSLDRVISQLRDAVGTQNTVANRLNQSISPDGSLKAAAVDETMHDIGSHTDSEEYVRMTKDQSDKLNRVADEASDVVVDIVIDDTTIPFHEGNLTLTPSSTITFSFETPNVLKFNMAFPAEAAHRHYYGSTPVSQDIVNPDYKTFWVNPGHTAFVSGSLKVYVNGVRLSSVYSIYVPGALVTDPWTLLSFTPTPATGAFALSDAISEDDVIEIDYDLLLVE